MKHLIRCALAALLLLATAPTHAQTVQADMNFTLGQPTNGCPLSGPCTSPQPLGPADALTKCGIWIATAPIPSTVINASRVATTPPTVELGPAATSSTQTVTATAGGKVYARFACANATGWGMLSNEVNRDVPVLTVPGIPTNFTFTITIRLPVSP